MEDIRRDEAEALIMKMDKESVKMAISYLRALLESGNNSTPVPKSIPEKR